MANRETLKAQKRELLGKKVGRLRRMGVMPATVYGHNVQPQSIQVDSHEFRAVLRRAGSTQLVDLVIEGERARPVLIRQTQIDPKRNALLHVEFFQANLREKIVTHIPLHFTGDSQAVRDGGIFLPILDHVDISSLPQDVPAGGLEVDVSGITEINGTIHAGELSLPGGIELVTAPDEVVCKVNPPVAEEVVEEAVEVTEPLPEELGGEEEQPEAVPEA
jgi:large subunit ribosomal protein L25